MTKLSVMQLLSALPFAGQLISRSFLPCSIFNKHFFNLSKLQCNTEYNYSNGNTLEGDKSRTFLPEAKKGYLFLQRPTLFSKPCIDAQGHGRERWGNRQIHCSAFPMHKNKDDKGKWDKINDKMNAISLYIFILPDN